MHCKINLIHPDDADKAKEACTIYDPSGVMAGIRTVQCSEEAQFADPNFRIADEERWQKTVCRKHYLQGQGLLRRMKPNPNDGVIPGWISYPEHHTTTLRAGMKPWQIMLLFTLSMSIVVAVLGSLFPSGGFFFFVTGAALIILTGSKVFSQGDSNETQS